MNDFIKTARWSLMTNRRHYVKMTVALTVVYFLIEAAYTGLFTAYTNATGPFDALAAVPMVLGAYIVASACVASTVASDLKTKQQRSLYMMLPASVKYKFWCRILLVTVWGFVVSALAVCLADVLQMLLSWIFSGTHASVVGAMGESIGSAELFFCSTCTASPATRTVLTVLWALSSAAWGFSSYVLGGFLFRKMPVVMTPIAWLVFWIAVCIGGVTVVMAIADNYDNVYIEFWWDKEITMCVLSIAACLLFTAFNLWWSYRIHKRLTVISHGLLNL